MHQHHQSSRSHGEYKSHPSSHKGRSEHPSISVSSSQPVSGNQANYSGLCSVCNVECKDLERHQQRYHRRPTQADLDASIENKERERPRYGKEMHPSNTNFSEHNTMTSSSFDSRQIPLETGREYENVGDEEDEVVPGNTSDSVTFSYPSQDPDFPDPKKLGAETWGKIWPSSLQSHSAHPQPKAPFTETSSSSSESIREYSRSYFHSLHDRQIPAPREYGYEDLDTSQTAQNQPPQGPRVVRPSPASFEDVGATSSIGYSYIIPGSAPLRSREPTSSTSPMLSHPQDDRIHEQNTRGYYSSTHSFSSRSDPRGHRDSESRENRHPGRRSYLSSADRPSRREYRDERPSGYMPHQAQAEPLRSSERNETTASAGFATGDARDGPPRTGYATSGGHFTRPEHTVHEGFRHVPRRSDLPNMEHLSLDDTGRYDTREYGGRYDDEYDSDNHQFTREQLQDMARTRYWTSDRDRRS